VRICVLSAAAVSDVWRVSGTESKDMATAGVGRVVDIFVDRYAG
jgi:hypothetical protein